MIGVIADDLSGAAEIGGVTWRYGLSAEIHTAPDQPSKSELVAADTDSRGCNNEEAARRVERVANQFRGAEWIYKKIDSVLRGPVLAELEITLKTLELERALLVPANPGLGRVIREGNYFVAGKPVHETDFRNDPLHPRHSSSVLELLGQRASESVRLCRPDEPLPARGIVVGEVTSKEDLLAWARKLDETILPVGAAEFFTAILETRGREPRNVPRCKEETNAGKTLFVCGSTSASTACFVDGCKARGIPVVSMPAGLVSAPDQSGRLIRAWTYAAIEANEKHREVVIAIDKEVVRDAATASRLGEFLVTVARAVLQNHHVDRVYVEGGATAAALVRVMQWHRLKVISELAPGVVTMRAGDNSDVTLTIKPGSYVWPNRVAAIKAPGAALPATSD